MSTPKLIRHSSDPRVLAIAEAVHVRDADRVLAEPWPFSWTPPGGGAAVVPWELGMTPEEWATWHRSAVEWAG